MTYDVDPFKIIGQGIAVFPTDPNDKRPVAANKAKHPVPPPPCDCDPAECEHEYPEVPRIAWSKKMTTDPEVVQRWITEYPGCRWGTPTGDVNGFFAVDIDTDEASDWWDEKWLPDGSDVTTPSGGRHIRYSMDPGEDIQTNRSSIHDGVDIRGEGGYIVAYTDDYSDLPLATDAILEILPRRTKRDEKAEAAEIAEVERYVAEHGERTEVTEQEKRVLKGITDKLDALPRPWHKGAGYHDVQFRAACHLWRIINNRKDYATTEEEAYALFVKHAPLRDKHDHELRDQRWREAKKYAEGQLADPPGETPVRLEVTDELLSKYADSEVDRLYWESKKIGEVKKLIHALRLKGATEQEAYSISYDAAAMKRIRKSGGTSSTWGFVVREYESPEPSSADSAFDEWGDDPAPDLDKPKEERTSVPVKILTDAERSVIRDYPNFIDNYINAAKKFYAKPNLPLHYVNAWIALSVGIGDKASIFLEQGRVPLSLWGFNLAPSAAGKSDANSHMHSTVDAMRPGGWAGVALGDDASAQSLIEILMDRPGKSTGIFMDECKEFLAVAKAQPASYQGVLLGTFLKLYDGRAERALRKGMEHDRIGEKADVSFTLWMQGAWKRVIEIMDESDIESGFVGRFLVAIGGDAEVTRESLTPRIASEYQVENGGRHPMIDAYAAPVRQAVARLDGDKNYIGFASDEVLDRYVDMREALEKYAAKHPLSEYLRGVLLRVGLNIMKGAALIALSEGRTLIEMEDMLIAMKSGEFWVKGSVELAEAISASKYRRLVDYLVTLVQSRPRTTAQILSAPKFKNMKKFEVDEIMDRAEKEGRINRLPTGVWEAAE